MSPPAAMSQVQVELLQLTHSSSLELHLDWIGFYIFAFAMGFTILKPDLSSEFWRERSLLSLDNLEMQCLCYNSQNVHDTLGKVTEHSIALHCNSIDAITVTFPVINHIHKPVNTSIFQEILEGALNGKKESIHQHIINVVNVSLPNTGGWVCWEKTQVFLQNKEEWI